MSATRMGCFVLSVILLTAGPAAANQPPGPQILAAEILMLPLMVLLSLAGGAYVILHALQPKRKARSVLPAAATVLAILVSATSGGIAVVIAAIFAALALQRGVQMVWWGFRARSADTKPPHLVQASPRRLLPAGAVLIVTTTFLTGMALCFAAYWPMGEGDRQKVFREFVAYQVAVGRQEQAKTGRVRYRRIDAQTPSQTSCPIRLPAAARVEYAPDATGFTLLLPPKTRFPLFPYNYLTSQPSYRADGTGQIRMIEVHDLDTICPSDGPVVARVSDAEIERMQQLLGGLDGCP
ncbi:MAG: hypothetical protein NTW68_00235 [candidate division NC10 bacterium]|nr:hypothetical protein [candidate division NC10 bacterium]